MPKFVPREIIRYRYKTKDIIMAKKERVITYADAMAEVEQIVARLRSSELSVDELSGAVRRANELIAECRKRLVATEEEVERLIRTEQ